MNYALISPQNDIVRFEPASRVNPSVQTKPGWRWLPVVEPVQPSITSMQSVTRNDVISGNEVVRGWTVTDRAPTSNDVNGERDRRLRQFMFAGKPFDFCDGGSDINIAGAGTLALAAIMAGAQAGNLRWADASVDFTWVAADNTSVPMDAHTTLNFAKAAADWKAKHIRTARAIKDMSPIPADYASNDRWPV